MNKKLIYIPLCILLSLLLITATVLGYLTVKGFGVSVGRLLLCDNGPPILVVDRSPICLSDQSKKQLIFEGYQTGDLLLVLHDGVVETYPARSGAYAVLRLKKGSIANIPDETISSLTDLGWLKK